MTKIDSKIPEGPVAEKWTNYKAHTLSLRKAVSMLQRIIKTTVTPFTVCSTIL